MTVGVGLPGARAATPDRSALAGLPLFFEANCGQADSPVQFVAHSRSGTILLSPTEVVVLQTAAQPPAGRRARSVDLRHNLPAEVNALSFRFVGGNSQAAMTGADPISGRVNYFIGSDPTVWQTEIPAFDRVRVSEIYPGIDLVYYGNQQKLEYDLVIAPGADAGAVSVQVSGADRLEVDAQGDLVMAVGTIQLRQHKPLLHQLIGGKRKEVTGGYRLKDSQTVTFEIGRYDPQWPLIIDPVLSYSSYFGAGSIDMAWDVALDAAGNVYMAGATLSARLPTTPGAFQTAYAGGTPGVAGDGFIAKFDNTCSNLIYMTYLGGSGDDAVLGIAADAAGNAYVTGVTDSRNFPVSSFAIRTNITGTPTPQLGVMPYDAFVAKLNPTGSALVYSTYVGGDTQEEGIAIAVDSAGCAYITGFTDSMNFPTVNPLQSVVGGDTDAFVSKINSNGTAFVYSTYLGGTYVDQGDGIAVDDLGYAYVTGVTESPDFPVWFADQYGLGGGQDAFVSIISPDGGDLVYSTYIGGAGDDAAYRITLDASGNVYLVGTESSTWASVASFPITPGSLNPGGIFSSSDTGATWNRSVTGLHHPRISSLAVDPALPNRILAGTGHGIARSIDGGATWRTYSPLYTFGGFAPAISVGQVFALAINPQSSSTVYAGAADGFYRSLDAGVTWSLSSTGLVFGSSIPYVHSIVFDPVTNSTMYLGSSLGIFYSTNSGATWARNTGLLNYDINVLAIDPQDPATFYAATIYGVYRSTNHGGLWTPFNRGLTNTYCLSFALDPQTPSTLYVGTADSLYKSVDRAATWTPLSLTLGFTSGLQINALALDPTTSTTIYAGTDQGVFRSQNAGATWSTLTNGLSPLGIASMAINPANPAQFYAGSTGLPTNSLSDAFLIKVDALSGAIHSTVLSGSAVNQGWAVAVDPAGNSYVTGVTTSTDFPTASTGFLNATNSGGRDAFVTAINSDASAFLYSAYLGGSADDFGYGIAVDRAGIAYVVGQTYSLNFPVVNGAQTNLAGDSDAFIAKIQMAATPSLTPLLVGNNLQLRWPAFPPGYLVETAPSLSPVTLWTTVTNQQPVLTNGSYTITIPAQGRAAFFRLHHP
jgi:photosystem II stability/assembly factor-like uncharacterized protein